MSDGASPGKDERMRWLPATGAIITTCALLLQLVLFLRKGPEVGLGPLASAAKFLTFMTNLTGIGVLVMLFAALRAGGARSSGDPVLQGAVLVYAVLVGLVYHFLLADVWHPDAAWWTAAFLLHDLMPACYVLYWWLCVPGGRLRWVHALWWQVFPVAYVTVVMLIGPRLGGYPYPFLDVEVVGWPDALRTMATVLAGYVSLSVLVVALDRWRGRAMDLKARRA